ncbi:unnamed protein product, partial [Polarella glacialis]
MLTNLHLLNLPKKTIIASDSGSATISSVKAFRIQKSGIASTSTMSWVGDDIFGESFPHSKKWNRFDLHHELVNHNAGEIVNPRGFTANGIKAVLKRWARKRQGGRMPSHSDRFARTALINAYQFRKVASRGETLDNGNTHYVPLAKFVQSRASQSERERKWGKNPKEVVGTIVSSTQTPYWLPEQDKQEMGFSSEMWFHPKGAGARAHMDPHCK